MCLYLWMVTRVTVRWYEVWQDGFIICSKLGHFQQWTFAQKLPWKDKKLYQTMEFFSRRKWTTGAVQHSNMDEILLGMCCKFFFRFVQKHNSLPLGPIQPSTPSIKDLHGQTLKKPSIIARYFLFFDKMVVFSRIWSHWWYGREKKTLHGRGIESYKS